MFSCLRLPKVLDLFLSIVYNTPCGFAVKYAPHPEWGRQQEEFNMKSKNSERTKRMVVLSLLSAIIVVLQIICTFIKFGPFSITLALAPIIIGAAIYGPRAGGFLGFVFSLVVIVTGLLGWDGGTVLYLMSINWLATVLIVLIKGTAAGFAAGAVYNLLAKKSKLGAVITAGVVCPVVNTGLFIIGMSLCFLSVLESWAGGEALVYYIIFGLTGINFLVELAVNMVLSSGIVRIIKAGKSV